MCLALETLASPCADTSCKASGHLWDTYLPAWVMQCSLWFGMYQCKEAGIFFRRHTCSCLSVSQQGRGTHCCTVTSHRTRMRAAS